MSAEFNLDTLQVTTKKPIGKCSGAVKLEQSVDVQYNGYNENAPMRLLMYNFQPEKTQCEAIETGVHVRGNVLMQAYGVTGCGEEMSFWKVEEVIPYETVLKCEEIIDAHSPMCFPNIRITSSDVKLNDRQKIGVNISLSVSAKVYDACEQNIVIGSSDDSLRIKLKSMPLNIFEGLFVESSNIEDSLVLPQAKPAIDKILFSKNNLGSWNIKHINDNFDVNGEVGVSVVYLADETSNSDEHLQCVDFVVPFSFTMDAYGVSDSADCIPAISISDFCVKEVEDEDGEYREINVKMSVEATVECSNKTEADIVDDVFCIGNKVKLTLESKDSELKTNEYLGTIPCIKGVEIDGSNVSEPRMILMSSGRVRDCALVVRDDHTLLSGNAEARIVYLTQDENDDDEYRSMTVEIPFQQEINDCTLDANVDYSHIVDVENCRSIVTMGNVLETKLDVVYKVVENSVSHMAVPVGVEYVAQDGESISNADNEIIMYVVKENEEVWDIAKHFLVAPESIVNIDGEQVEDSLIAGSRVFIV